jgi:hypothetical protein
VARRPCHLLSAKSKAKYAKTITIIVITGAKIALLVKKYCPLTPFNFFNSFNSPKNITFAGGNYSPTTKNNGKTEKIHPSGE